MIESSFLRTSASARHGMQKKKNVFFYRRCGGCTDGSARSAARGEILERAEDPTEKRR